jgi:hypothetical protein
MKRAGIIGFVLCLAIVVEALLIGRAWMQATAADASSSAATSLFSFTHDLAAPFAIFTGEQASDETGIIDFTVLVAIEGYFLLALAVIALIYVVGTAGTSIGHRGPGDAILADPTFAQPEVNRLWQVRRSTRFPGARFCVPVVRRRPTRYQGKAGLGGT